MNFKFPVVSSDSEDDDEDDRESDDSPSAEKEKGRFGKPVSEPNLASDVKGILTMNVPRMLEKMSHAYNLVLRTHAENVLCR